jgi:hypothetical protein
LQVWLVDLYPLNPHDIPTIYAMKERMLEHLETLPKGLNDGNIAIVLLADSGNSAIFVKSNNKS